MHGLKFAGLAAAIVAIALQFAPAQEANAATSVVVSHSRYRHDRYYNHRRYHHYHHYGHHVHRHYHRW